jgi:hypothetical protein
LAKAKRNFHELSSKCFFIQLELAFFFHPKFEAPLDQFAALIIKLEKNFISAHESSEILKLHE